MDMERDLEGKLTYTKYLRIHELLALQHPLTKPPHPDELLFIQIHQIYELWFKQVLAELDRAMTTLRDDNLWDCFKVFKRIHAIQRVLLEQIGVLETMTPREFNQFRNNLRPASGFQSFQFRALEYLGGLKEKGYLEFHNHDAAALKMLQDVMAAPTLYDEVLALFKRRGFEIPDEVINRDVAAPYKADERVTLAFKKVYDDTDFYFDLYLLLENLIEYDELFQLWRHRHVKMVERAIGMKQGTGGSSGAAYLKSTLEKRCFPEIWDVRTLLG